MALTWLLGLIMAGMGHWFASGWLQVKIPLAVLLTGLYGLQSGTLQRMVDGKTVQASVLLNGSALFTVGTAATAISMAIFKPF